MDRPPSFPPYQNPNPNFFHRAHPPPPLQNSNTYSIPPSPPPIRDPSGTLSSLQSLLSECQRTLDSLSQNLSLEHSSLLHKDGFLNNGDGNLCFSLDDVTDFGNNFFYNDCPGVVNFSELNDNSLG
ncbi:hypothetical protein F2Q68_00018334 [Brassica cretica]|uniref:Uncharacterized protein n=1 Tax=Brassica cretica TaxID=69181 RepID=A0A8S9H9Z7_BRACR|nr:hypothetical protein F2Q68_00018334 [Brassica cretica]